MKTSLDRHGSWLPLMLVPASALAKPRPPRTSAPRSSSARRSAVSRRLRGARSRRKYHSFSRCVRMNTAEERAERRPRCATQPRSARPSARTRTSPPRTTASRSRSSTAPTRTARTPTASASPPRRASTSRPMTSQDADEATEFKNAAKECAAERPSGDDERRSASVRGVLRHATSATRSASASRASSRTPTLRPIVTVHGRAVRGAKARGSDGSPRLHPAQPSGRRPGRPLEQLVGQRLERGGRRGPPSPPRRRASSAPPRGRPPRPPRTGRASPPSRRAASAAEARSASRRCGHALRRRERERVLAAGVGAEAARPAQAERRHGPPGGAAGAPSAARRCPARSRSSRRRPAARRPAPRSPPAADQQVQRRAGPRSWSRPGSRARAPPVRREAPPMPAL